MENKDIKKNNQVQKSLKYSVKAKFVNFDPKKFGSKIIIVNGTPALKIKDKIYVKIR